MRTQIVAFVAGLIFSLGLVLSQMINPAKVLGFLDIAGTWDPSLAFVMGGAVIVTFIAFRIAGRRAKPILADSFQIPTRQDIDLPLIAGASLFGIGWGLVGLCPGPAIAQVALLQPPGLAFVAAILAGSLIYQIAHGGSLAGGKAAGSGSARA